MAKRQAGCVCVCEFVRCLISSVFLTWEAYLCVKACKGMVSLCVCLSMWGKSPLLLNPLYQHWVCVKENVCCMPAALLAACVSVCVCHKSFTQQHHYHVFKIKCDMWFVHCVWLFSVYSDSIVWHHLFAPTHVQHSAPCKTKSQNSLFTMFNWNQRKLLCHYHFHIWSNIDSGL